MLLYRQGQIYPWDVFKSGPVSSGDTTGSKKDRRGRMAGQPRAEAGDGYGAIGQQTDREDWIAGW